MFLSISTNYTKVFKYITLDESKYFFLGEKKVIFTQSV